MDFRTIRLAVADGVAALTLNRPDRRNAIDLEMREELRTAVDRLRRDETVRSVILAGAGGNFCAGGDIRSMQTRTGGPEAARKRLRDNADWCEGLITLDKPVIAAVAGAAFGAGFSLALAADFILASPDARFCASFGRVGLVPDFGCHYTLPRRVGLAKAKELIFSARDIEADEALALGIVFRIVPADRLAAVADELARRFLAASPAAIGIAKTILDQTFSLDLRQVLEAEANGQALCLETGYHREAIDRFLNKQPARLAWPREPE